MSDDLIRILAKLPTTGEADLTPCTMTLHECQTYVGGYIEILRTRTPGELLVINEEGTLDELPYNAQASMAVHPDYYVLDGIRGNALIILETDDL